MNRFRPWWSRFDSVEALAAAMHRIGVPQDVLQLRPGAFRADLMLIPLDQLQLVRIRLNQPVLAIGAKSDSTVLLSLSLAPIAAGAVGLQSHGTPLAEDAIYGLDSGRDIHLVTPDRYGLVLMGINRQVLFDRAEALGCPELEGPLRGQNWLRIEPGRLQELRQLLAGIIARAEGQPAEFEQLTERRRWSGDLVPLVLEALVDGMERRQGRLREPSRIELVKLTEAWARAHPHTPITLEDLCRLVHASRRSLMRGFQEHLGMGPMAYLKLQRLHGVRRQLQSAEPGRATVVELAAAWGFSNAGHFAHDYRHHFGEAPNQTLRQRPPA